MEKQYSLYCGKEDRLTDIAKFLIDLQTIPNVSSEDQFVFKENERDAPIPHHQTVREIAGESPCEFELFVEVIGKGKNGKNGKNGKSCWRVF